MNWYKNHTLYEFVLYNMYNLYVKKRFASGLGFKPRTKWLAIVPAARIHRPTSSTSAHFIYVPYNKITIHPMRIIQFDPYGI